VIKAQPKEKIMGGRLAGPEELYLADRSPLKRTRGAIFMRLKQDLTKTHCFIVSSEFVILLQDQKEKSRESTVFGSVSDGLAVCDAISHLDLTKDNVNISDAGVI
jgi:cyclophilin family peptidyl-prolyl cis-trans isomerase